MFQLILVTSVVASTPLTTLAPCPEAPPELSIKPITVTTQLQAVSTCSPSSHCVKGRCLTSYLFETYAYISTVIPYAWNGTTVQSTTVTRTDQLVVVSEAHTTLFQTHSTAAAGHWKYFGFPNYGHGRQQKQESEILTKRAVASFQDIGPFAIPGWAGSNSSNNIELHKFHSHEQRVQVFECRLSKRWRKCMVWQETWVFNPDLRFSSSVVIPVHTSVNVLSQGVICGNFHKSFL